MNKFDSAYEAASALTSLDDIENFEGSSALLVSALMSIIQIDIKAVEFGQLRYEPLLSESLDNLYSACNKVSLKAYAVGEGKVERAELNILLSAVFRLVCDIQSDLNGEERFPWKSTRDHNQIIADLVAS